jgi:hypothetical protein
MSGDVQHGSRHAPRGSDPAWIDTPILVGDDPRVPFINGSNATPTAESPTPSPLQFGFVAGLPNDCEYAGWAGTDPATGARPVASAINAYNLHLIEIVGDVTGVSFGDTVFVLPMEYRYPNDRPCKGHDDAGNYVPCRLLSTGEFIWGVP